MPVEASYNPSRKRSSTAESAIAQPQAIQYLTAQSLSKLAGFDCDGEHTLVTS